MAEEEAVGRACRPSPERLGQDDRVGLLRASQAGRAGLDAASLGGADTRTCGRATSRWRSRSSASKGTATCSRRCSAAARPCRRRSSASGRMLATDWVSVSSIATAAATFVSRSRPSPPSAPEPDGRCGGALAPARPAARADAVARGLPAAEGRVLRRPLVPGRRQRRDRRGDGRRDLPRGFAPKRRDGVSRPCTAGTCTRAGAAVTPSTRRSKTSTGSPAICTSRPARWASGRARSGIRTIPRSPRHARRSRSRVA